MRRVYRTLPGVRQLAGRTRRRLFQRDDYLVGTDQPEVSANQFVRHVRIGLPGVQKRGTMPQPITLGIQLGEFRLPLLKVAMVTAPGKQAVRTRNRMAREGADDRQRQRRHRRAADQSNALVSCPSHKETESESGRGIKHFRETLRAFSAQLAE